MNKQGEEDYKLLLDSWERVRANETLFVDNFYQALFAANPQYRDLFDNDLSKQKLKFLEMMNVIVNGVKYLEALMPTIKELGQKHAALGVAPEDYDRVVDAFTLAFKQTCPNVPAKEVQAWQDILFKLKEIMIDC